MFSGILQSQVRYNRVFMSYEWIYWVPLLLSDCLHHAVSLMCLVTLPAQQSLQLRRILLQHYSHIFLSAYQHQQVTLSAGG
jgi:hypothetical protein